MEQSWREILQSVTVVVCTSQWWRRIVRAWCKCRRCQFTSVPDNSGLRLLMLAVGQSINHGHCEHRLDNTSVSTCSTSLPTSLHTELSSRTMSYTVMLLLLLMMMMMMMKVVVESTATWMRHSHQLLQRDVKRPSSVAIIDAINSSWSPTRMSYT